MNPTDRFFVLNGIPKIPHGRFSVLERLFELRINGMVASWPINDSNGRRPIGIKQHAPELINLSIYFQFNRLPKAHVQDVTGRAPMYNGDGIPFRRFHAEAGQRASAPSVPRPLSQGWGLMGIAHVRGLNRLTHHRARL
jgi:hypothetical protein